MSGLGSVCCSGSSPVKQEDKKNINISVSTDKKWKVPNKNVVRYQYKIMEKRYVQNNNENANLQKKSRKVINSLLLKCCHNSHKADFGDSKGNRKKNTSNNKPQTKACRNK